MVLVVATKGEHGEVPEGFLDPGEELWQRRVKETEAAYAEQVRQRLEKHLQRRAKELGYELKKIENEKMTAASSSSSLTNAPATKNSADSGIPINMKGRGRPKRVQTRSDRAPIVGWMTAPSMLRVLDRSPMSRSGAPNDFKIGGSTKLLNE